MKDIETLKKQVLKQASFLQVTRENPDNIPSGFEFQLVNGTHFQWLDSGVLLVKASHFSSQLLSHSSPKQAAQPLKKKLVISSGIHGNETAPIEIVDNLVKLIIQDKLIVKNDCLFIIGNPQAMNIGQRFISENLNRLFCGKHQGKQHGEAVRARNLEKYVSEFFKQDPEINQQHKCYHFDLHTAIRGSKYKKFAIYPYADGRDWDKSQLQFFLSSGINTLLLGHQPAGTFSYYSSHNFNAHAFTVELGQVRPFGENDMEDYAAIILNLKRLISDEPVTVKPFDNKDFNLFQVKEELSRKSEQQFKLNIAEDCENFTSFPQGFQLTQDEDGGYQTQLENEAIVFPNSKVPVGQRAGLIVIKTQLD